MASISDLYESTALLRSRVEDVITLCERRSMPTFLGFLDETEQQIVHQMLKRHDPTRFCFYGGFDEAERRIFGYFPDYLETKPEAFPLVKIAFSYPSDRPLTHRDFLGTTMSLGIKRETIGDILCGDGLTVLFLRQEIASYICEQVTKVGGIGVNIIADYEGPLPRAHTFVQIQDTIASQRLDVVVKALVRCSREDAAQRIMAGLVSVDHIITQQVSTRVVAPCVISVHGVGRFMIDQIGPPTKKGRLYLTARKCV